MNLPNPVINQVRITTLDRDVALKVMPEAFTADPDRLARFEREAKLLASLNHRGIAAIYGLEEFADTKVLVPELIFTCPPGWARSSACH